MVWITSGASLANVCPWSRENGIPPSMVSGVDGLGGSHAPDNVDSEHKFQPGLYLIYEVRSSYNMNHVVQPER